LWAFHLLRRHLHHTIQPDRVTWWACEKIAQGGARRSRVRIPSGCEVFRNLNIAVLLSWLNIYTKKIILKNHPKCGPTRFSPKVPPKFALLV
jgi:hypothetical protein